MTDAPEIRQAATAEDMIAELTRERDEARGEYLGASRERDALSREVVRLLVDNDGLRRRIRLLEAEIDEMPHLAE